MVTELPLYRNYLFVIGIALLALGLGNYGAAHFKVARYQATATEAAPIVQPASSALFNDLGVSPSDEARERWDITRAKFDFYQVVLSAGRLMMSLGAICTAIALMRFRHRRLRPYRLSV